MNGRRRHPRFLLPDPAQGVLRLREEVTLERWDDEGIEVLSSTPCCPGEQLTLEVAGNGGKPLGVIVRDSRVSLGSGDTIRYRIVLAIEGERAPGEGIEL